MTHVVTEACIRCKYTDCVDVVIGAGDATGGAVAAALRARGLHRVREPLRRPTSSVDVNLEIGAGDGNRTHVTRPVPRARSTTYVERGAACD